MMATISRAFSVVFILDDIFDLKLYVFDRKTDIRISDERKLVCIFIIIAII